MVPILIKLKSACTDKDNKAVAEKLQWAKAQRAKGLPTIPSTIGVRFFAPLASERQATLTAVSEGTKLPHQVPSILMPGGAQLQPLSEVL